MGIKEKDLENYILNLLDTSSAIQRKIQSICLAEQDSDYDAGQCNDDLSAENQKIASQDSMIEQLRNQLEECQYDYKQAVSKIQEYKKNYSQLKEKCEIIQSDKEKLENQISLFEKNSKKIKTELDTSRKRLKEKENENVQLKGNCESLSSELEDANNEIQSLKDRFVYPVILLEHYKTLPASVRTGLSDIICDKDEVLFIVSCSNPDHLKAIWIYTKKLLGKKGDCKSVEVLKEIFDYFFEVFNSSLSEPMYVRDSVEEGCSFDDDKYDRCTGSSTSGKISEVILRGYKSENTGTVICRSVVRV